MQHLPQDRRAVLEDLIVSNSGYAESLYQLFDALSQYNSAMQALTNYQDDGITRGETEATVRQNAAQTEGQLFYMIQKMKVDYKFVSVDYPLDVLFEMQKPADLQKIDPQTRIDMCTKLINLREHCGNLVLDYLRAYNSLPNLKLGDVTAFMGSPILVDEHFLRFPTNKLHSIAQHELKKLQQQSEPAMSMSPGSSPRSMSVDSMDSMASGDPANDHTYFRPPAAKISSANSIGARGIFRPGTSSASSTSSANDPAAASRSTGSSTNASEDSDYQPAPHRGGGRR